MNAKREIYRIIDEKKDDFINVSDAVWEANETRFNTKESMKSFCQVLEKEGFCIETGLAHMEYAFCATYGSGSPVIGILAEYDALGNMSQVCDLGEKKQQVEGGNGHGCGHNVLGAGALAGAVGIKVYMEQHGLDGTIKLFGCPAEESGYGKAFMARDGVFDSLDIALTWHPSDISSAWSASSLAVYQAYFNFKGVSSHAAASPELGRSALDAAELMNVGVQFLREHIVDSGRVHYAFMDAGGESANVVQPSASLYYFVRAKTLGEAQSIFERVGKIANGAAIMTETEVEMVFDSACANYIPNRVLTTVMYDNLVDTGSLNLTEDDMEYERRYYDSLPSSAKERLYSRAKMTFPELSEKEWKEMAESPILENIMPMVFSDGASGSTDVGDVSWVVPTAQVFIGFEPQGTPAHSWQWVANGKSSVAHKGVLAAGRIIAATAYDVLTNPELLKQAKAEHVKMLDGRVYESGIPADVRPR